MTGSSPLRLAAFSWLGSLSVLTAPMLGSPQNLPTPPGAAAQTGAAPKQLPKTERQKWTALREAARLSQRAEIYEKQGQASKAEQMAEAALLLEEQVRGPWHLNIAQRLDQVADLYTAHKKEEAAEPLYERARAIRERALSVHPDVYESHEGELLPKPRQPADQAVNGGVKGDHGDILAGEKKPKP